MEVERLAALSADRRATLCEREQSIATIQDEVSSIIDRVRARGDEALRSYADEFDDVVLESIDITEQTRAAATEVPPPVQDALEEAASNIRSFHQEQLPTDWRQTKDGRTIGRRFRTLDRVGVYVPGGTAAYPSSALMGVIPADVAGVGEIVAVTPPATEISPVTSAALHIAGVDEVYASGGAQAIAALAYGTETIDPVQKIVGPGNRWVTAAKATVRGDVAIDFLAGPSEILVIADSSASPTYIAADLIAQAEHDPHASVVAVTPDPETAAGIVDAIDDQLPNRSRSDIVAQALSQPHSGVFLTSSLEAATTFGEDYAPEHLAIHTTDPEPVLEAIPSAGSAFLGSMTPVAAGDYATGTNHILPTGGGARVHGGLAVETFLRATTVQSLNRDGLESLRETITTLATVEGLEGHATSVETRFRN